MSGPSEVRSVAADNPFVTGEPSKSVGEGYSGGTAAGRKSPRLVAGSSRRRASFDDSASFSSSGRDGSSEGRTEGSERMAKTRSVGGDTNSSQRHLARRISSSDTRVSYAGTFAPNPSFIRLLRFILYSLVSLSAIATAGVGISVVAYYNARPSIAPSWGSLIALIVFGIITPGAYFGTFLITPRLFRYGTFAGIINQVRIELLLLFSMDVIWVSGALAMAADLRGYENCIWDGWLYYPKPANFHHVCVLINATVVMGYVTFGLVTLTFVTVTAIATYILLYLDQEVLSELTNDMGGRAYRARTYALALQQQRQAAEYGAYSEKPGHRRTQSYAGTQTARPYSGGSEDRAASRAIPAEMAYNRPPSMSERSEGPMMARSAREEAAWDQRMRDV